MALPSCGYGEFEGVFVSAQGRAQRARAALKPRPLSEPVWRILRELGARFGMAAGQTSASAVFDEVAATVQAFGGLSYRALGDLGAPVKGA